MKLIWVRIVSVLLEALWLMITWDIVVEVVWCVYCFIIWIWVGHCSQDNHDNDDSLDSQTGEESDDWHGDNYHKTLIFLTCQQSCALWLRYQGDTKDGIISRVEEDSYDVILESDPVLIRQDSRTVDDCKKSLMEGGTLCLTHE